MNQWNNRVATVACRYLYICRLRFEKKADIRKGGVDIFSFHTFTLKWTRSMLDTLRISGYNN